MALHRHIHAGNWSPTYYFSKGPDAFGLPKSNANGVANLFEIWMFQCASASHEFVNEINQRLFKKVGLEHMISSANPR